MRAIARSLIVAVAICSWFAISNHCAFAALATKRESVQVACPFHSNPAKQENPSAGAQCCKILRAVAPVATNGWIRDDAKYSGSNWHCDARTVTSPYSQTILAPLFLDTGPPDARSFAELILQRSLFAHAPPVRV
jgi:hypothetical protein